MLFNVNSSAALIVGSAALGGLCAGAALGCSRADGLDSTAVVAVDTNTRMSPPETAAGECATPKAAWIWCDDFEADRISKYFEYNKADGRFARQSGVGRDGSFGMAARYVTDASDAGSLMLAFGKTPDGYVKPVDAGTKLYREIYWRWYIMHPATWRGGGPDKMTRAISLVNSRWGETMFAHVWDGEGNDDKLLLDPASGTDAAGNLRATVYNDFNNMRWLGAARSTTNIFDSAHLGKWICVEARAKLNDPGQSNGTFDLWIDGEQEAGRSGLNWLGSYSAFGINAVFLENYWNTRSPVEQTRFWDNVVVSTERIGC